jgi:transketolase
MVAIMNGISLYGGYIPCGGSFLVFTDYARPAIRLAALMNRKIILIMTHDSIGVGEDGPTHQPIEHLASLRAIPNLYVFRPADKIECLESWENALLLDNPSVFCLSRQNLPQIREFSEENLVKKGAYIIKDTKNASVTIFASGSELQIALDAADKLFNMNIKAKVISVVCWELFEKMDKQYKEVLLENNTIKVAIEAAGSFGWEKFIGRDGIFIGMNEFGLSGPSNDLFEYFKITSNEVVKRVTNKIGEKK